MLRERAFPLVLVALGGGAILWPLLRSPSLSPGQIYLQLFGIWAGVIAVLFLRARSLREDPAPFPPGSEGSGGSHG